MVFLSITETGSIKPLTNANLDPMQCKLQGCPCLFVVDNEIPDINSTQPAQSYRTSAWGTAADMNHGHPPLLRFVR